MNFRDIEYNYTFLGHISKFILPNINPYIDQNHKFKSIFIHIPKTAGRSIGQTIFEKNTGHNPAIRYYYYDKNSFKKYWKFTFVRNPWSRMLSAYDSLIECKDEISSFGKFIRENICQYVNFEDFLKSIDKSEDLKYNKVMRWTHFIPQYKFITYKKIFNNDCKLLVDFVGKFENIENDFEIVKNKLHLNMQIKEVGKRNKGLNYRDYYNKKTKLLINDMYKQDIELFKYEF